MKKDISKLSPTELRKYKKDRAYESDEKLEAMGSESESEGMKATKEVMKEAALKKKKEDEERLNKLDALRKQKSEYRVRLQYLLHNSILKIGIPQTWQWGVWFDGKGIRVTLVDQYGRSHRRAFIPSYEPKYDLNALARFSIWAEDVKDFLTTNGSPKPRN